MKKERVKTKTFTAKTRLQLYNLICDHTLARFLDLERPKKEKVMAIINGSSQSFGQALSEFGKALECGEKTLTKA